MMATHMTAHATPTIPALTPDTSSAAALEGVFKHFLWGMLAIFLFAGIGNASTFPQMPMIFEKRQGTVSSAGPQPSPPSGRSSSASA